MFRPPAVYRATVPHFVLFVYGGLVIKAHQAVLTTVRESKRGRNLVIERGITFSSSLQCFRGVPCSTRNPVDEKARTVLEETGQLRQRIQN
jgi:hypothetical protein